MEVRIDASKDGPGGDGPRQALPLEACLDFVNTLAWRGSARPTEHLLGLDDLLAWATRNAAPAPVVPDAGLFEAAITLRELIHRVFAARAEERPVAPADLAALNAALASAPARAALTPEGGAYAWQTVPGQPPSAVGRLLAPVLWSAADLLAQGSRTVVRACANPDCRWLFIDASRNGSRRWCLMAACGNRAKAQRHYLKQKAGAPGRTSSDPRPH
jgi:predicted RNA-binding Zn ribbon-like protein